MKVTFTQQLEEWQAPVYNAVVGQLGSGKRFIVKSGRQRGKTFLLKMLVVDYCLRYPGSESVIIEPISSQCRRVFSEIVDSLETTPLIKSSNASDCIIKLRNGSQITFKSGESKKAVRGLTCSGLCIIDECAFIDDEVIEVVLPIINVHKCPVLAVSTPMFTEGWFYKQYMKNSNRTIQFDWAWDKYNFENYLSKELYDEYKTEYTPNKFRTEILGEFISDSSFLFGEFKESIIKPDDEIPVYAGIDFGAGTGADSTVVTFFNKYRQVINIWSTNVLAPSAQIDYIAQLINERPTLLKVLVEGNSIGEVYFSSIQSKLKNKMVLDKFMTTNDSKKEIIEDLILAFQKKEIGIIDDPMLLKQLAYYDIQKTKTGYTYNNSNDSIHDDFVMSLAIGYHCFKVGTINVGFGFKRKKKVNRSDER